MQNINDEWWVDAKVCDNAIISVYPYYACDFNGGNWYSGTFKWGTFNNGKFIRSIWHDGVWESGKWKGGYWLNGVWKNGVIYYGYEKQHDHGEEFVSPKVVFKPKLTLSLNYAKYTVEVKKINYTKIRKPNLKKVKNVEELEIEFDDESLGNVWHYGIWQNGLWDGRDWHNGSWYRGTWPNGIWHDGFWHDGVWLSGTWINGTWWKGLWVSGYWVNGTVTNKKEEEFVVKISPKSYFKPKLTISLNYATYK